MLVIGAMINIKIVASWLFYDIIGQAVKLDQSNDPSITRNPSFVSQNELKLTYGKVEFIVPKIC
jgi:hypothetical protein